MSARPARLLALAVFCLCAAATLAQPRTSSFVVDTTADTVDAEPGDGICADANGNCSLRAAIMESNTTAYETQITVGPGDYITSLTAGAADAAYGDLDIYTSTTIVGAGADLTLITNGIPGERVLDLAGGDSASVQLTSLTIRGGDTSEQGGAIRASTVRMLHLDHVEITDNHADEGGGIWLGSFRSFSLQRSTIAYNVADGSCGGIYIGAGGTDSIAIKSSTLAYNSALAGNGGAVCYSEDVVKGGFSAHISFSTIAYNTAGASGGGVFTQTSYKPDLRYSIMAANTAGHNGANCASAAPAAVTFSDMYQSIFDTNGCDSASEFTLSTAAPILGVFELHSPGQTRTFSLAYGSPALDTADCRLEFGYDTDQRLVTRPQGPLCDAGAFELETGPEQTYTVDYEGDTVDADLGDAICADSLGRCSLRAALMQANAFGNEDTIIVPAGAYFSSLTSGPTDDSYGDFDILHPVALQGVNAIETVIGSGVAGERVLEIAVTKFSGETLFGTAIYIENVSIVGGSATENGGGIYIDTDILVSLYQTEVAGNQAANGGGTWIERAAVFLAEDSSYVENTAIGSCGGVYVGRIEYAFFQLTSVTIAKNRALSGEGGGLCFSENASDSFIALYLTTVYDNSAATTGGGVMGRTTHSDGNRPSVAYGSIFAGNTAGISGANCAFAAPATSAFMVTELTLFDTDDCIDNSIGDIVADQPLLGKLALHAPGTTRTVNLLPGSPAVDAFPHGYCNVADQRGVSRCMGMSADFGAYELIVPTVMIQPQHVETSQPIPLSVTEGGVTDTFEIVLMTEPQGTVTYTLSDAGGDLSFSPAQVTFDAANWDVPVTVTVGAVSDFINEGDETTSVIFAFSGSAAEYADVIVPALVADITDKPVGSVTVSPFDPPLVVAEQGGSAAFSFALNIAPSGSVVYTPDGGGDLVFDPPTLEFGPSDWDEPVTVTVTAVDDALVEGDEEITVTFAFSGEALNYAEVVPAPVTIAVEDNDTASLSWQHSHYEVPEAVEGGLLNAHVVLNIVSAADGGALAAPVSMSVTLSDEEASAVSGVDFNLLTTAVTFPVGSVSGDTRPVTFEIIDDAIYEGDLGVYVVLTGPAEGPIIDVSAEARVVILDDETNITQEELLSDGGWETGESVAGWKYSPKNAKRRCGGKGDQSACALVLKAGTPRGKAYQNADALDLNFVPGTALHLSFVAKIKGEAKLKVIVKMKGAGKQSAAVKVTPQPTKTGGAWKSFGKVYEIPDSFFTVTWLRVQFKHNSPAGKIFVDDVSLLKVSPARSRLQDAQPILPPPAFRGSN